MNSGGMLFFGLFATMSCSWLTFVMGPQLQIGDMQSETNIVVGATGQVYPNPEPGTAHQGAEVYRANGCDACHTQQVRPRQDGSDIARGWGVRRSTAVDYIYDQPVMLGLQRVGPDLANAGLRTDTASFLLRLYDSRLIPNNGHSIMPSYPYLFHRQKIKYAPSLDALRLSGKDTPPAGYEIVPTPQARALAAYIASLHQEGYLFEAPPPLMPKGKTNAAANGATNSLAK